MNRTSNVYLKRKNCFWTHFYSLIFAIFWLLFLSTQLWMLLRRLILLRISPSRWKKGGDFGKKAWTIRYCIIMSFSGAVWQTAKEYDKNKKPSVIVIIKMCWCFFKQKTVNWIINGNWCSVQTVSWKKLRIPRLKFLISRMINFSCDRFYRRISAAWFKLHFPSHWWNCLSILNCFDGFQSSFLDAIKIINAHQNVCQNK